MQATLLSFSLPVPNTLSSLFRFFCSGRLTPFLVTYSFVFFELVSDYLTRVVGHLKAIAKIGREAMMPELDLPCRQYQRNKNKTRFTLTKFQSLANTISSCFLSQKFDE